MSVISNLAIHISATYIFSIMKSNVKRINQNSLRRIRIKPTMDEDASKYRKVNHLRYEKEQIY